MKNRDKIIFNEYTAYFPKKWFTKEEAEQMLIELEKPTLKTKAGQKYQEWLDGIPDEEFERRFKRKKLGNFKVTGEAHIRFKFQYEEPDCFGEVWSDEPYHVPYITDKLGRGAIAVWTSNFDQYGDIGVWDSFCEETRFIEKEFENES